MHKYILMCALAIILVYPTEAKNEVRELGMADYICEYLKIFDNLEFAEVRAAVKHESGDNPENITPEPTVNDKSWGPLCVRTKTLRGMGFKGDPHELLNWKVGLYWGMKYMSICKSRAKRSVIAELGVADQHVIRRRMFSLYNAGNLYFKTVVEDGKHKKVYRNRNYVTKCEYYYWRYLPSARKLMGNPQS